MSNIQISAYFRNEDEAFGTMMKLKTVGARNCSVEEMQVGDDDFAFPVAFAGLGAGSTGGSGLGMGGNIGVGGSQTFGAGAALPFLEHEDSRYQKVVLRCTVEEIKQDEILQIIKAGGGHIQ